jgi:hypothetical protein
MHPRVLRLGACLLGASMLLLLLGSLLPSAMPVRSSSSLVNNLVRSGVITDTRWLELIRSLAPGPQLNRTAAAAPTLNLQLIDNVIAGHASSAAWISIEIWRNKTEIVSTGATPYFDGLDYFYSVEFGQQVQWQGITTLEAGDVITLTQNGASFTMTVPALTARVDTSTDRVAGRAPISHTVTIYLYSGATETGPYTRTSSVDTGGRYTAEYSGVLDIRPRDSGYVAYAETPEHVVFLRCVAPLIQAQVNGTLVSGLMAPYATTALTVTTADGTLRLSRTVDADAEGDFYLHLDYPQSAAPLQAGEHVIVDGAGQTLSMTVISITTQVDLDGGQVTGQTLPRRPIELRRFTGPLDGYSFLSELDAEAVVERAVTTSTAGGFYSAPLALTRTNYGATIVTLPDGNETFALWAVPYLAISLGANNSFYGSISGQVDQPFAAITLTVQGPSGYTKNMLFLQSQYAALFNSGLYPVAANDTVIVAMARGGQVALTLPFMTGEFDATTGTADGLAPPHAALRLEIRDLNTGLKYSTMVTATDQGSYFVDFSRAGLSTNLDGTVSVALPGGHTVSRVLTDKSSPPSCNPQVTAIFVRRNQFHLALPGNCSCVFGLGQVRLRDAKGQLKSTKSFGLSNDYCYFLPPSGFYSGTQPILILPGDTFELESTVSGTFGYTSTTTSTTIAVPTLTVQLDEAANAVYGQAPANAILSLDLQNAGVSQLTLTMTADAQGEYGASLAGQYALGTDDVVNLSYQHSGPPVFVAADSLTALHARLYGLGWWPYASGWLPPYEPYTLLLNTSRHAPVRHQNLALGDGHFYEEFQEIDTFRPGDTLILTTPNIIRQIILPDLSAQIERGTATVFGQAMPNTRVRVDISDQFYGQPPRATALTTATANGMYSVSFPALAGNTLYGTLTDLDTDGDQAALDFGSTQWNVRLDQLELSGRAPMSSPLITVTLRSGTDVFKSWIDAPAQPYYHQYFTATVQSGDHLLLRLDDVTETFTVPSLTAQYDYALHMLTGRTNAKQLVGAELGDPYNIRLQTMSDAAGYYGLDISGTPPRPHDPVAVSIVDEAGNTTTREIIITGLHQFLPIVRR